MTDPKPMSVEVENGKYTFTVSPAGEVAVLRHGEPWMNIDKCAKAMIALIYSLNEARAERDAEKLNKIVGFYENEYPKYTDKWTHELQSPVTAAECNGMVATLKAEREAHEKTKVELARSRECWAVDSENKQRMMVEQARKIDSLRKLLEEAQSEDCLETKLAEERKRHEYWKELVTQLRKQLEGAETKLSITLSMSHAGGLPAYVNQAIYTIERLKAENERLKNLGVSCYPPIHFETLRDENLNLREKLADAQGAVVERDGYWEELKKSEKLIGVLEEKLAAAEYECEVRGETILKREREAVLIRQQERQRAAEIVRNYFPYSYSKEKVAQQILADDPVEEKNDFTDPCMSNDHYINQGYCTACGKKSNE